MEGCSFTIVVPNYNNAQWLDKMFESIYAQTYKDYSVIFVDDVSTDNSVDIATKWSDKFKELSSEVDVLVNAEKRWNGGSRNAARSSHLWEPGGYTLFLDSDDWFADEHCLEDIASALKANNYPDLLRLSYLTLIGEEVGYSNLGDQDTVNKIVSNNNVACWTKCVKTEKLVPFPENTLMEDVTQHIAQLDNVDTVAASSRGVIVWNRNNSNSCSRDTKLQGAKWESSLYRYYADLLDLRVSRPECQVELERRRAIAHDNVLNGRFEQ